MELLLLDMVYDILTKYSEELRSIKEMINRQGRLIKINEYLSKYPFLLKKRIVKKFINDVSDTCLNEKTLLAVETLIKGINFSLYEEDYRDIKWNDDLAVIFDKSIYLNMLEQKEHIEKIILSCNTLLEIKETSSLLDFDKCVDEYLTLMTADTLTKYSDVFSELILYWVSKQEEKYSFLMKKKEQLERKESILSIPTIKKKRIDILSGNYDYDFVDISHKAKYFRKLLNTDIELALSLMMNEKDIILARIIYDINEDYLTAVELDSLEDIEILLNEKNLVASILNGGEKKWEKKK